MIKEIYQLLGFVAVFLIILSLVHLYIVWWLRKIKNTHNATPRPVKIIYFAMASIFTIGLTLVFLRSELDIGILFYTDTIFSGYLLVIGYFAFFLFCIQLSLFCARLFKLDLPLSSPKRLQITYALFAIAVILTIYAAINKNTIKIVEHHLPLSKKIALISDTHMGKKHNPAELDKWLGKVAELNPDYVILAGDIVDLTITAVDTESLKKVLGKYTAKFPIIAVLGNHDLFDVPNLPLLKTTLIESGVKLLVDEKFCPNKDICFFGRMDDGGRRQRFDRKALEDILPKDKPANQDWILVSHKPDFIGEIENRKIDLAVYGHTHNGQVFPMNIITELMWDFSYGLYKVGTTAVITSSGIGGVENFPFRVGSNSEIVLIQPSK